MFTFYLRTGSTLLNLELWNCVNQHNTTVLPSVNTLIARGMSRGAKHTHHTFTPIIKHLTTTTTANKHPGQKSPIDKKHEKSRWHEAAHITQYSVSHIPSGVWSGLPLACFATVQMMQNNANQTFILPIPNEFSERKEKRSYTGMLMLRWSWLQFVMQSACCMKYSRLEFLPRQHRPPPPLPLPPPSVCLKKNYGDTVSL